MLKDLRLDQILDIANELSEIYHKDAIYDYLKNQDVIQNCGSNTRYDELIKLICDKLDY